MTTGYHTVTEQHTHRVGWAVRQLSTLKRKDVMMLYTVLLNVICSVCYASCLNCVPYAYILVSGF